MPKPPSTRDSLSKLLEPSTALEEVWAHLAATDHLIASQDGTATGYGTATGHGAATEHEPTAEADGSETGEVREAVSSKQELWARTVEGARNRFARDVHELALEWSEALGHLDRDPHGAVFAPSQWVAWLSPQTWHGRVDGLSLEFLALDEDGECAAAPYSAEGQGEPPQPVLRATPACLGGLARALGAGANSGSTAGGLALRLVAARLVQATCERLSSAELQGANSDAPQLWLTCDDPPAAFLGTREDEAWSAASEWIWDSQTT